MKGRIKKCIAAVTASAMLLTTVYGGMLLSDSNTDVRADNTAEELPAEYLDAYNGNITYGAGLYVWSGDNAFDPKDYHPDGSLNGDESVSYHDGQIDLTPGAASQVVYRITDSQGNDRYELYSFTAVSEKSSSTVHSGEQDNIIYGLERPEGFGGYVPADYTECGKTYEDDRELNIVKGTDYYPELSFLNYDSDTYVLSIADGDLKTDTPGTYTLTYSVSPVSDARMYWYEKYTVNVTEKEEESKGMKVTAADNVIHATVTDKNGYDTEVYMGKDYDLNAGVHQIRVQNLRGYEAYADIEVLKDGKAVSTDEIVESVTGTGDEYVIAFKNRYEYEGYEVRLSNKKVMEELLSRPDNAVNGGWDSHINDGIIVDEKSDPSAKTIASLTMDMLGTVAASFDTGVQAATNIKQGSVLTAVTGVSGSHTVEEYHNGKPTGVLVYDGVQVKFSKSKLTTLINSLIGSQGLALVSTNDVPTSMYLNCVDHGDAGYYASQLSKAMLTYVSAYLRKDGDTYYVELVGQYYASGRQKLMGAYKIPVIQKPAYIQIVKKTDAGGEAGVVEGAVYGVYSTKSNAEKGKNALFTLTLDRDGKATTTAAQAKKLKTAATYYIKETKNPAGTYLNTKVYTVKTTADGTTKEKAVRLTTSNRAWKIRVKVHKREKNTGKDLSGAEFTVYQWNGSRYVKAAGVGNNGVITTNSSGDASTGWLYYTKKNRGKWRITETKAPPGHKIDPSATKDYQIKKANAEESEEAPLLWTVDNPVDTEYGYISVQKAVTDKDGNNVSYDYDMAATFTVYSDSGCTKAVATIHTNGNTGYGKSGKIPVGTYYVKETSWNAGYEPADKDAVKEAKVTKDATFKIEAEISETAKEVGNQTPWYAGLAAKKVDAVTGEPLAGAEFTFYEWNGKRYVPLAVRTSGTDGVARISVEENLVRWTKTNQGMFAVAETKAPDDHKIDDASMKYTVIDNHNKYTLIELDRFTDTPYGFLDITKIITDVLGNKNTSYDFSSAALGISYGLYYDSACTRPVSGYDNIILEENGHYRTGALVPGTYYLRENTLNPAFFSNPAGLSTEVIIYPGMTTYLDGEKGLSYDNQTWDSSIW